MRGVLGRLRGQPAAGRLKINMITGSWGSRQVDLFMGQLVKGFSP